MVTRSLCYIVFFLSTATSQTLHDVSNTYYIGRGEHALLEEARSFALSNMVEQIQVLVSSSFHSIASENNSGLRDSTYRSTLSKSSIMLRDVQETIEQGQGVYRVTKFVSKAVPTRQQAAQFNFPTMPGGKYCG